MTDVPTDAFNRWHHSKAAQFSAQAVDVIHYLQDALAQCRAGSDIEAMRQACADDCASLERQLEDKEAELAFEEKAHGQTLAERDALRAEVEQYKAMEAKYYPQDLRAEVQDKQAELWGQQAIIQDKEAELTALRARVAELEANIGLQAKRKLREEVERLKTARDGFYDDAVELRKQLIDLRERIAELELLLLHVICQTDANSTINLDAIRAALAGTKEGDTPDSATDAWKTSRRT